MSAVSDEGKRVSNLAINGAVIGLTAISLSKLSTAVLPKALPATKLSFAPCDLTMNIMFLSVGTLFQQLLERNGVFLLIK